MEKEKFENACAVIDSIAPSIKELMSLNYEDSNQEILLATDEWYNSRKGKHLLDKWKTCQKDFGRFYLNLEVRLQRKIIEYYEIEVEDPEVTFPDTPEGNMKKFELQMKEGRSKLYPFQTEALFLFLRMCYNNSLELSYQMEGHEVLNKALKKSRAKLFGNTKNWMKYYCYLVANNIQERHQFVEYAINKG